MDTSLNSKGDAAVTQALSQAFSMFVPPVMSPDVKPLIKLKLIPLEHSTLPAIFLISLFSLLCDSRMKLPSSNTWLFTSVLLNSAGAVTLAGFQMTSVITKVTQRFRHTVELITDAYCVAGQRSKRIPAEWTNTFVTQMHFVRGRNN